MTGFSSIFLTAQPRYELLQEPTCLLEEKTNRLQEPSTLVRSEWQGAITGSSISV